MKKNNNQITKTICFALFAYIWGCEAPDILLHTIKPAVVQAKIDRIDAMPEQPTPYQMEDWKEKAIQLDNYLFDHDLTGPHLPFIWGDQAQRNFPIDGFGIYTAIGDVRQGPTTNQGEAHEAIAMLGALLGASLVGIDKSSDQRINYVAPVINYFNSHNNWNIVMNFTSKAAHVGGGYGNDFWYDVYNNVLFYALGHFYHDQPLVDSLLHIVAEQYYLADSILGDNYSYSYFDFSSMTPGKNHIPAQEDVAAGFAYILYCAYLHFDEEKYLKGAQHALNVLLSQKDSRFYEILMPFGAYIGARLNAEANTKYDTKPFLEWTFSGKATNRTGWGVIAEKWGNYDVYGLVGSTIDRGGYAFLMNTFGLAWPLVPMVKYEPQYAHMIGKWMLNAANAARLFYPYNIPDSLQAVPHLKSITKNLIGYEGLIKHNNLKGFESITPLAQGDGPLWADGNPPESMFSIYGSAHVGIFGSIIQKTDVEKILLLDCNATDLYPAHELLPTYLAYNPYEEDKIISYDLDQTSHHVYDLVSKQFILTNRSGKINISLPSRGARVLVFVPVENKIETKDGILWAGESVIDYGYGE